MEQYIPKDALVAEIESRIKSLEECFNGKFPMSQSVKETEQDKGKLVAYKSILSFTDTLEVIDVPIWEKVSPDTGQTTLYRDEDKSYLERFGYRIDLKELDKLPKKNLKDQKGEGVW